jgi:capsular polysaccharide biosynthesis protein
VTVGDVYWALWRHRFFILVCTVGLLAIVWVLTERQTEKYTASTLVRVQQKVTDQGEAFGALQTAERLARTYAIIAETETIQNKVTALLAGRVARDDVVVEAEQVENLELLRLAVENPSPETAALIANAVPRALSSFVAGQAVRDEITTVERASAPTSPSSPNLALNLAIALTLGLILYGAIAILLDVLRDNVGDAEAVEHAFGYPVLATIPSLKFVPVEAPRSGSGQGARAARVSAAASGSVRGQEA